MRSPKLAALCVCAGLAGTQALAAMNREEYKAQKAQIEAEYRAGRTQCRSQKGNARDVCEVQVRGNYKVAKAELEARNNPTPRHEEKVKMERADAAYQLAREKCDDRSGPEREACRNDAKAAFVHAKGDARVSRVSGEHGPASQEAIRARQDDIGKTNDSMYAAARAHCESLSANDKEHCLNDAKKKYARQ